MVKRVQKFVPKMSGLRPQAGLGTRALGIDLTDLVPVAQVFTPQN